MTTAERGSDHEVGIIENITINLYDLEAIRETVSDWASLSKPEKLKLVRNREPAEEVRVSNLTTTNLHEYIVENLHADTAVNESATHLAVGTDNTTPSSANDALNNEVYRVGVTDSVDNGNELLLSTFLDSTEANGYDLVECGIFTADTGGLLLNHSTFQTVSKSNTNTATIDVTLRFQNPA